MSLTATGSGEERSKVATLSGMNNSGLHTSSVGSEHVGSSADASMDAANVAAAASASARIRSLLVAHHGDVGDDQWLPSSAPPNTEATAEAIRPAGGDAGFPPLPLNYFTVGATHNSSAPPGRHSAYRSDPLPRMVPVGMYREPVAAPGGLRGQRVVPFPAMPPARAADTAGVRSLPLDAADGRRGPPTVQLLPSEYCDRQRLLYHITYLATQLQRAELTIGALRRQAGGAVWGVRSDATAAEAGGVDSERGAEAPGTAGTKPPRSPGTSGQLEPPLLPERVLASFDPIIAQEQINRLDNAVAQLSLLREAELRNAGQLEHDAQQLRRERNELAERCDRLGEASAQLSQANESLRERLASAEGEVERLRFEEDRLSQMVVRMQQLHDDGHPLEGVRLVMDGARTRSETSASPRAEEDAQRLERLFVEMDEAACRQDLLLDLLMEPMQMAFEAGTVWISNAAQLHAAAPRAPREGLEGLIHSAVAGEVSSLSASVEHVGHSSHRTDLLILRGEVESLKQRLLIAQDDKDRADRALRLEQRRCETMAKEHRGQMETVHKQIVMERQYFIENLVADIEHQMRNAFRDGQLFERQQDATRRHRGAAAKREEHARPLLEDD